MRHIFTFFIVIAITSTMRAADVNLAAPGSLSDNISSPLTETSLRVKGEINAADLKFIASDMPALTTLDLSEATVSDNLIPRHIFADSKIETLYLPKNGELTIGELAFAGSSLKKITLGDNIVKIEIGAFSSCPGLTTATFSGKTDFDSHVFASCPVLETVTISDPDSIAAYTFSGCSSLKSVIGDSDISRIGNSAFASCSALDSFMFSDRLASIGESAFVSSALTSIDLSVCSSLTSIGNWAFAHCASLESAILPSSLTNIGEGIFFDCSELAAIKLPDNLASIDNYALKGIAVDQLTLPAKVSSIGDLAMSGLDHLSEIDATDIKAVPALGTDVWDTLDKSKVTLHVPTELSSDFMSAPQWQDFEIVTKSTNVAEEALVPDAVRIMGCIEGSDLVVKALGTEIKTLRIYDPDGRLILTADGSGSELRIPLNRLTGSILIAEVITATNHRAVLKLTH